MQGNLLKILAIGGGCAGVVGGGTAVYLTRDKEVKNETPANPVANEEPKDTGEKSITEWLQGENIGILTDDVAAWKQNWTKFKEQYTGGKIPQGDWKLDNWAEVSGQADAPQSFKDKCKSNADTKIKTKEGSELYTNLKKYCTKQSTG